LEFGIPNWQPLMIPLTVAPNLIQQVYDRILESIVDHSLKPGHRIRQQALAEKLGGSGRADEMFDHVTAIAAADGLTLDFDRAIAANTFDAHRLIAWAAAQDRQGDMLDALQRAHFRYGVDVGSRTALADVAAGIGLDRRAALAYLESDAGTGAVQADLDEARELGITSVPTFVVDGKYAVQGAQEPATLIAALEEISRREAVDAGR